MTRLRWAPFAGILIASAVLGFVLRDVAYQWIIVPAAYIVWLAGLYYSAIPQSLIWALLALFLLLGTTWRLIPDPGKPRGRRNEGPRREGPVESLAVWIRRGRSSNYFKWQLANRLARLAHKIPEGRVAWHDGRPNAESVRQYLSAGINQSFVDFPAARGPFQPRVTTPLDLDPREAVDYLESQMELSRDRRR